MNKRLRAKAYRVLFGLLLAVLLVLASSVARFSYPGMAGYRTHAVSLGASGIFELLAGPALQPDTYTLELEDTSIEYRLDTSVLDIVEKLRFPQDGEDMKRRALEQLEHKALVRFYDSGPLGTGCAACQVVIALDPETQELLVLSLNPGEDDHDVELTVTGMDGEFLSVSDVTRSGYTLRLDQADGEELLVLQQRDDLDVRILSVEEVESEREESVSGQQEEEDLPPEPQEAVEGREWDLQDDAPSDGGTGVALPSGALGRLGPVSNPYGTDTPMVTMVSLSGGGYVEAEMMPGETSRPRYPTGRTDPPNDRPDRDDDYEIEITPDDDDDDTVDSGEAGSSGEGPVAGEQPSQAPAPQPEPAVPDVPAQPEEPAQQEEPSGAEADSGPAPEEAEPDDGEEEETGEPDVVEEPVTTHLLYTVIILERQVAYYDGMLLEAASLPVPGGGMLVFTGIVPSPEASVVVTNFTTLEAALLQAESAGSGAGPLRVTVAAGTIDFPRPIRVQLARGVEFSVDGSVGGRAVFLMAGGNQRHLYLDLQGGGAKKLEAAQGSIVFDGAGTGGGIEVTGNPTAAMRLVNLDFTGCVAPADDSYGGAVSLKNRTGMGNIFGEADPGGFNYLEGCTFTDNSAQTGGAVYLAGTGTAGETHHLVINSSTFEGNTAMDDGGGVYSSKTGSTVLVRNSRIFGNHAGGRGGGLYLSSQSLQVEDSSVEGNSAVQNGGGIFAGGERAVFSGTVFSGNTTSAAGAGAGGGAVSVSAAGDGAYGYSHAVFSDCTFTGNEAVQAGGLLLSDDSTVEITRCEFKGNTATGENGGALLVARRTDGQRQSVLTDSVFTGNAAPGGKGGAAYLGSSGSNDPNHLGGGALVVAGCTFEDNQAREGGAIYGQKRIEIIASEARASLFLTNRAAFGGAVYGRGNAGVLDLYVGDEVRFSVNTAERDGGAIYLESMAAAHLDAGSAVTNNVAAGDGGGIYVARDSYGDARENLVLAGCAMEGNRAGTGYDWALDEGATDYLRTLEGLHNMLMRVTSTSVSPYSGQPYPHAYNNDDISVRVPAFSLDVQMLLNGSGEGDRYVDGEGPDAFIELELVNNRDMVVAAGRLTVADGSISWNAFPGLEEGDPQRTEGLPAQLPYGTYTVRETTADGSYVLRSVTSSAAPTGSLQARHTYNNSSATFHIAYNGSGETGIVPTLTVRLNHTYKETRRGTSSVSLVNTVEGNAETAQRFSFRLVPVDAQVPVIELGTVAVGGTIRDIEGIRYGIWYAVEETAVTGYGSPEVTVHYHRGQGDAHTSGSLLRVTEQYKDDIVIEVVNQSAMSAVAALEVRALVNGSPSAGTLLPREEFAVSITLPGDGGTFTQHVGSNQSRAAAFQGLPEALPVGNYTVEQIMLGGSESIYEAERIIVTATAGGKETVTDHGGFAVAPDTEKVLVEVHAKPITTGDYNNLNGDHITLTHRGTAKERMTFTLWPYDTGKNQKIDSSALPPIQVEVDPGATTGRITGIVYGVTYQVEAPGQSFDISITGAGGVAPGDTFQVTKPANQVSILAVERGGINAAAIHIRHETSGGTVDSNLREEDFRFTLATAGGGSYRGAAPARETGALRWTPALQGVLPPGKIVVRGEDMGSNYQLAAVSVQADDRQVTVSPQKDGFAFSLDGAGEVDITLTWQRKETGATGDAAVTLSTQGAVSGNRILLTPIGEHAGQFKQLSYAVDALPDGALEGIAYGVRYRVSVEGGGHHHIGINGMATREFVLHESSKVAEDARQRDKTVRIDISGGDVEGPVFQLLVDGEPGGSHGTGETLELELLQAGNGLHYRGEVDSKSGEVNWYTQTGAAVPDQDMRQLPTGSYTLRQLSGTGSCFVPAGVAVAAGGVETTFAPGEDALLDIGDGAMVVSLRYSREATTGEEPISFTVTVDGNGTPSGEDGRFAYRLYPLDDNGNRMAEGYVELAFEGGQLERGIYKQDGIAGLLYGATYEVAAHRVPNGLRALPAVVDAGHAEGGSRNTFVVSKDAGETAISAACNVEGFRPARILKATRLVEGKEDGGLQLPEESFQVVLASNRDPALRFTATVSSHSPAITWAGLPASLPYGDYTVTEMPVEGSAFEPAVVDIYIDGKPLASDGVFSVDDRVGSVEIVVNSRMRRTGADDGEVLLQVVLLDSSQEENPNGEPAVIWFTADEAGLDHRFSVQVQPGGEPQPVEGLLYGVTYTVVQHPIPNGLEVGYSAGSLRVEAGAAPITVTVTGTDRFYSREGTEIAPA